MQNLEPPVKNVLIVLHEKSFMIVNHHVQIVIGK